MGEQVAARFPWGYSSVGRAPALQAGGQGFESLYLHSTDESLLNSADANASGLFLENRILKLKSIISSLQNDITRHPRDLAEM